MHWFFLIEESFKTMVHSKLRTFLTMLGIVIGLAAIVVMVAIGQGVSQQIQDQISSFGDNLITVFPAPPNTSGARGSTSSGVRLTKDDYEVIKKNSEYLSGVSPIVQIFAQLITSQGNWNTRLYGASEDYLDIRKLELKDGRNFTYQEVQSYAKVCIIGQTIVENLFPDSDPVGQTIRVNKALLTVIGVLEKKGSNSFMDQDDIIIAPYTTAMNRLGTSRRNIQQIVCSARSKEEMDLAYEEVRTILRQKHRLSDTDEDDFRIQNQQDVLEASKQTSSVLTMFLACIAGISLLVGGIGIMNIMLVTVAERTKEIGLRRAIGARKIDIQQQFLFDSVVICIAGGTVGILLGVSVVALLKVVTTLTLIISPLSIIVGFTISFATGVFFGYYPARKAALMNPIDALRYE